MFTIQDILSTILLSVAALILIYSIILVYVRYTHKTIEICVPIWFNLYFFFYVGYATDVLIKTEIGFIEV